MHIHGTPQPNQFMTLASTQGAQQTAAARKVATETRSKLKTYAATADEESVNRVEPRGDGEPGRRRNPQQNTEGEFRSIFVSVSA